MTARVDPPPGSSAQPALGWRGLLAAMAGIGAFAASAALTFPLLSLLMERADVSATGIGVNSAMAAIGILASGPIAPRWMARLGVTPFLALCVVISTLVLLSFNVWSSYEWWLVARFLLGFFTGGMFLASEYWIVSAAPDAIRGRIVAAYAIVLSLGLAAGPSILATVGVDGWTPFLVGAALIASALVPIAVAWSDGPPVERKGASGAVQFFWKAPSLIWAVVLFGVVEFGVMALTPVWGVQLGMSETTAITLGIALAAGNLLFQPLLGWAADTFPERPVLFSCAAACIVVALVLPMITDAYIAILAVFFIWGGMAAGLYTVSLTALGGRYRGGELAAANAAMVMAYGVGALIGPPSVGVAMDVFGPNGLSVALGVVSVAYCLLVIIRSRRAT